jgi:hypothetical protein
MSSSAPALQELRASRPFPQRTGPTGSLIYRLITTTDHKVIGIMYVVACFTFFFVGGLMALLIRGELAAPGLQFLSNEQYNQLFTMHGTVMLLFYATPIVFGFANLVLPLQIGAPGCRLSAGQRIVVVALCVRCDHRPGGLHRPRWASGLRLDRLHPAFRRDPFPGAGR